MVSSLLELMLLSFIVGAMVWVSACGKRDNVSVRTHVDTVAEVGTSTFRSSYQYSFQFPAHGYTVTEEAKGRRVILTQGTPEDAALVVVEVGEGVEKSVDVIEFVIKNGEPARLSFHGASQALRNLIIRTFDASD